MTNCLNLLHISDLHFHVSEYAPENFGSKLCIDNIASSIGQQNGILNESNTVIIITGDLTESGTLPEFFLLSDSLRKLSSNHVFFAAVPGNHDYQFLNKGSKNLQNDTKHHQLAFIPQENGYKKLRFEYPEKNRNLFFPLYFKARGHHFIGLDSTNKVNARSIFPVGNLGADQRKKFQELLKSLKNRPNEEKIIIFTHHHPFPLPYGGDSNPKSTHSMKDWEQFNDIFNSIESANPIADALLFGHEHVQMPFINGSNLHRFLKSKKYGCSKVPIILGSGKTPLSNRALKDIDEKNQPILEMEEKRSAFMLQICKKKNYAIEVFTLDLGKPLQEQVSTLSNCKTCEFRNS